MKTNYFFRRISAALATTTAAITPSYATDSFSTVGTGTGTVGFGTWARNLATEIMGSVSLVEAGIYFAAVVCFILGVATLIKHRRTRGQDGDMGMVAVWFISCVLLMAAPTFMGGFIRSATGSGAVNTVRPSNSPSFTN